MTATGHNQRMVVFVFASVFVYIFVPIFASMFVPVLKSGCSEITGEEKTAGFANQGSW